MLYMEKNLIGGDLKANKTESHFFDANNRPVSQAEMRVIKSHAASPMAATPEKFASASEPDRTEEPNSGNVMLTEVPFQTDSNRKTNLKSRNNQRALVKTAADQAESKASRL